MRWIGAYRCNLCLATWAAPAGPQTCPQCKSYVSIKWLNFEKLRAQYPWHEAALWEKRP